MSPLQTHTGREGSWPGSQRDHEGGSSQFHWLSSLAFELQNYPCCNDLYFIVYCLLTLQIRNALGSLGWKVLAKYILLLFLLLLSLRLFTNRSVKVDSEQVLPRLMCLPGIYLCCCIVSRCEQGKPCTQSALCLSGLPIPANHQVIYFQFIRLKLPLAVGSL